MMPSNSLLPKRVGDALDGLLELTDARGVSRRLDRELPAFIGRHGPVRTQTRLGRLHAAARRV